jgi:ferredoxin-thioredoxin reductase catalytic chain
MYKMLMIGLVLGFSLGMIFFYFMTLLELHTKLKGLLKRFWDKAGEILIYLVHRINGDIPLEEEPEVTPETPINLLPFTKFNETTVPWWEQVAKRLGVHINPNTEVRDTVLEGLERNKEKYGARYCPCLNPSYYQTGGTAATSVCPCYKMRNNGICHCGLFITHLPETKFPELAGQEIPAKGFPGSKYIFDKDGTPQIVPLDGSEGPSEIVEVKSTDGTTELIAEIPPEIQSKIDEANASAPSITASTKEPIPYVYDCIDLHVKKEVTA